jgi:hypothetical protein
MTISASSTDHRRGDEDPLTRRTGPGSGRLRRPRRHLNARVAIALIVLVSLMAPGLAPVIAAVL